MKLLLFTQSGCPNCPDAKEITKRVAAKLGIRLEEVNAQEISEELEHVLLLNQIYIASVPASVVQNNGSFKILYTGSVPEEDELMSKIGEFATEVGERLK